MIIDYYFDAFKQYATFSGRARRSEYWYFQLFNFLTTILIGAIAFFTFKESAVFIILLYGLVVMLPSLALVVRRLHDIGKSGWYYFVSFIPIVGSIWILVLLVTDSQYGPNEYGLNPKGLGNEDEEDETQINQIGR
jgi:uncharacterized membrane protein YhaH (DUF805 family)